MLASSAKSVHAHACLQQSFRYSTSLQLRENEKRSHAAKRNEEYKMRTAFMRRALLIFLAFCLPLNAQAATGYRLATIDEVQSSSSSVANGRIVYVAQSSGWIGSVNCPTQWAYFSAEADPHFLATVIAAELAGRSIRVYVDDSLPKIGGYCQIAHLSIAGP